MMTLGEEEGVEAGDLSSSYGDTMWSSDMCGAETGPWGTAFPRGRSAPSIAGNHTWHSPTAIHLGCPSSGLGECRQDALPAHTQTPLGCHTSANAHPYPDSAPKDQHSTRHEYMIFNAYPEWQNPRPGIMFRI